MKMLKPLAAAAVASCVILAGCASIVHSGPRKIPVSSTPAGAKVSIYDRSNTLVVTNTTPFVAALNTKFGYFKSQEYRLVFEMPGYATSEVRLESKVSGWYYGNLVLGGLIGMLIVDPLTGAMFNLTPEKVEQPLTGKQAELLKSGEGFMVVLLEETTASERAHMVRVN